jgi:hypothetical protein
MILIELLPFEVQWTGTWGAVTTRRPLCSIVLAALVGAAPLPSSAQAVSPSGSISFQPLVVGSFGGVAVKSSRASRRPKQTPADASKVEEVPVNNLAPVSAQTHQAPRKPIAIDVKLRALDREASRGNMSLEDYRGRKDKILGGN